MDSLKQEFEYFINHQGELVQQYNGKFIVIKDQEVKGSYSTMEEAYIEGKKKYELGTFLIQHCVPGRDAYTQTFHSRVSFSE